MTERLSQLLHDEAATLDIPAANASAVLATGRGMRRRRAAFGGTAAAVAVAAAGAFAASALTSLPDGEPEEDYVAVAYSADGYAEQGAIAVDRKLYVAGKHIPFDEAVKSFYYTSAGVVVRSGKSPWTDHSDVDHYTLVRPDGSRKSVDLKTSDRVVGTEPDSPNLAYMERTGDRWDVVVVDVDRGEEIARHPVEVDGEWGGWEAPPAAIDGDVVWVRFGGDATEVNWRTGQVRQVPGSGSVYEIANGYYADWRISEWILRRMKDGAEVSRFASTDDIYAFFSPDGRWMKVWDQDTGPGEKSKPTYLFDVVGGERHPLPEGSSTYEVGWTPGGDLLVLDKTGAVRICNPATGRCTDTDLDFEVGEDTVVKLGGNPYES